MNARDPDRASDDPLGRRRLRRYLFVAVPLAAVLGVAAIMSYSYLKYRQRYFSDRYVRALGALAEQTESAIEGLDSAVDGAMSDWTKRAALLAEQGERFVGPPFCADVDAAANGSQPCAAAREERLCAFAPELAQQLDLVPLRLSTTLPPHARPTPYGGSPGVLARAHVRRNPQTRSSRRRVPTTVELPAVDTADATLYFCRETPSQVRIAALSGNCGWPAATDWICAEQQLTSLLDPLVKGSTLEQLDLFVVDEQGTTLYERGSSGLRLAALKTTAQSAATDADGEPTSAVGLPSLAEVVGTTLVRPLQVGGTSYVLFSQPMRLRARDTAQYRTWAIGALVPLATLRKEAHRMPIAVVSGVPVACVLAILALPMLKILTAGPRERLTRRDVAGVAGGLLLASALATVAVLVWYADHQVRQNVDDELRLFSGELQASFRAEVADVNAMLTAFSERRRQQIGKAVLGADEYVLCDRVLDASKRGCRSSEGVDPPDPQDFEDIFAMYPSFEMLVLVDGSGWQREKWTVASINTPVINLAASSAFEDALRARTLRLPESPASRNGSSRAWNSGYALNVQLSQNTGKLVTLFSIPVWDQPPEHGVARRFDHNATRRWQPDGVAMVVPRLLSLDDVVTPPGVDFAVIESNGRVVFHSNDRHRLYENFFAEAAGDHDLRSALFTSRAGYFDIEYHGAGKRVFAGPLENTHWSLIVFRDTGALRTAAIQAIAIAAFGVACAAALLVIWLSLARAVLGRRVAACLWPDPRANARYRTLFAALIVLAAWFVWMLQTADAVATLLVTGAVPLVALGLSGLVLSPGHTTAVRWLIAAGGVVVVAVPLVVAGVVLHGWSSALLWIAIVGLVTVSLASWEPSWLPVPNGRWYPTLYAAVALALIVNLAVLPTASFFRDAFDLNASAVGRARQLDLAERLNRQRDSRWQHMRNGGTVLAPFLWPKESAGVIAFTKTAERFAVSNGDTAPARPFASKVFDAVRWRFPEFCTDGSVKGPECRTEIDGPTFDRDLSADRCRLYAASFTAPVASVLPMFNEDALQLRHAVYGHAYDCLWSAGERDVLHTKSRYQRDRQPDGREEPLESRQEPLECRADDRGLWPQGRWPWANGWRRSLPSPTLRLRLPSSSIDWIVLALIAVVGSAVVWYGLRSLTRRLFCLDVQDAPSGDAAELAAALLAPDGSGGEPSYRALWMSLSEDERLVLHHLARDGFVHANNRDAVAHLMRRGLIRRAPALELTDEGFRSFVRHAEEPATIRKWERAEGISVWGWLRHGIIAAVVVAGTIVFLTQPDSYAQWAGLITALTSAGGGIAQVLGLFSGAQRPQPSAS